MGAEKQQIELLKRAQQEFVRWGNRPVILQMDIATAVVYCAALQLALRHPQFSRMPSSDKVRLLLRDFRASILDDYLAIRELIDRGFPAESYF